MDVEYLKVNNANSKKSAMSWNDHEMHNNASCPQLPEISESKFDTKSKLSHKSKKSPPKYKYKYGVQCKPYLPFYTPIRFCKTLAFDSSSDSS